MRSLFHMARNSARMILSTLILRKVYLNIIFATTARFLKCAHNISLGLHKVKQFLTFVFIQLKLTFKRSFVIVRNFALWGQSVAAITFDDCAVSNDLFFDVDEVFGFWSYDQAVVFWEVVFVGFVCSYGLTQCLLIIISKHIRWIRLRLKNLLRPWQVIIKINLWLVLIQSWLLYSPDVNNIKSRLRNFMTKLLFEILPLRISGKVKILRRSWKLPIEIFVAICWRSSGFYNFNIVFL